MGKKILCFVLAAVVVMGSALTAHAKELEGPKDAKVTFDGKNITSNFTDTDIVKGFENVQPGDTISLSVSLENKKSGNTDWYMTNEVVKALEDGSRATNGAYEYRLVYKGNNGNEQVIYDSETVGGDGSKGLHEIPNSKEQYFYLGRLAQNENGLVTLRIHVEGETQGNGYQATLARMRLNFAVEDVVEGSTITKEKVIYNKVKSTVKTGDTKNILFLCVAALSSGFILLIIGTYMLKKHERRNKKGQ